MPNNPVIEPSPKTQELLPCPFCGGEAVGSGYSSYGSVNWESYEFEAPKPQASFFKIKCGSCGLSQTDQFCIEPKEAYVKSVTTWNTRTSLQGGQSE